MKTFAAYIIATLANEGAKNDTAYKMSAYWAKMQKIICLMIVYWLCSSKDLILSL